MSFQPIGDSLVLARLAYEIYRKGYQVAKHAPDEFNKLLEELRFSRDFFWWMQETVKGDNSVYVRDALKKCQRVLEEDFRPMVKKFEKLAYTDRGIFFKRVQFAVDQKEITSCRNNLKNAQDSLHIVLTAHSIWHPCAAVSAPRQPQARNTGQLGEEEEESDADSFITVPDEVEEEREDMEDITELPRLSSFGTGQSLPYRTSAIDFSADADNGIPSSSAVRSSSIRSEDVGSRTSSDPSSPLPNIVSRAPYFQSPHGSSMADRPESLRVQRASTMTVPSTEIRTQSDKTCTLRRDQFSRGLMEREFSGPPVLEQAFEQNARPPENSVDVASWLCIAVWWYLKSKNIWDILTAESAEKPASSWLSTVSLFQSNIDLLKSDYILRKSVLGKLNVGDKLNESQWATIKDLAAGIRNERWRRKISAENLMDNDIVDPDFSFTESFSQPAEDPSTISDGMEIPQAIDSLDPVDKWLAIEQDHAGSWRKEVIYRGFVNAEIGDAMRRSPSAPYLLLLSSPKGSSDLMVSLVNQRGTVSLSRSMTGDDLHAFDADAKTPTTFEFDFPSQKAVIDFLSTDDIDKFLERPRKFFAATTEREPQEGEFLVFRETLGSFSDVKPDLFSTLRATDEKRPRQPSKMPSQKSRSSCEISLYEKVPNEYWKTTRRLVICSSPDEHDPWCVSFWLPLSEARVAVAGHEVKVAWSDFKNHVQKPSGDFWYIHSFLYRPASPNREVHLSFESDTVAETFAICVLNPFSTPFEMQEHINKLADFDCNGQELIFYQMRNLDAGPVGYHAVVTIGRAPNSQYQSSVYFLFLDLDFKVNVNEHELSVEFFNLTVPNYVSTMEDLNEFPQEEEPELKTIKYLSKESTFAFKDFKVLKQFIRLVTGWSLELHCHARSLTLSHSYGMSSSTTRDVEISLWEQAQVPEGSSDVRKLRMTARSIQGNEPWWTTVNLDKTTGVEKHEGNAVIIGKDVEVQHGTKVECRDMGAVRPSRQQESAIHKGKLRIKFDEERSAWSFVKNLPSNDWIPPTRTTTHESVGGSSEFPFSMRSTQRTQSEIPPDWIPPARTGTHQSLGLSQSSSSTRNTQRTRSEIPPEFLPEGLTRRGTEESFGFPGLSTRQSSLDTLGFPVQRRSTRGSSFGPALPPTYE